MRKNYITLSLIVILTLTACGGDTEEDDGKLTVVATSSILTDVLMQVAGDNVEVIGLMPQGQDPHGFEPSPRDMARVELADILFVNGFGLEENFLDTLENVFKGVTVEVSHGIPVLEFGDGHDEHEEDEEDDEHDHLIDPHTWMSPLNVMVWVDNITAALIEADPENANAYKSRADQYLADLKALDSRIRQSITNYNLTDRLIVTDHRVLGYFARDYGFDVSLSILSGFSSNSEASSREMAKLIDALETYNIKALFLGDTASEGMTKLAEAIKSESGRELSIHILFTGALAPKGDDGDSYLGFMNYNVGKIIEGLTGEID